MIPRKFLAATSREALYKVREALGEEAIILSNKQVPGGVEIIAVSEREMDAFAYEAETHSGAHEDTASFSVPNWPRYPEPGIGAAAHYQHWQSVSSNPYVDENAASVAVTEPLQDLNQYWHRQSHGTRASRTEEETSWRHPSRPSEAAVPPTSGAVSRGMKDPPVYASSKVSPPSGQTLTSSSARSGGAQSGVGGNQTYPVSSSRPSQGPLGKPSQQNTVPFSSKPTNTQHPVTPIEGGGGKSAGVSRSSGGDEVTIQHELKLLRSMLEGQLAGFAWHELSQRTPLHLTLMRWMLSAGISPALSREVLDSAPASLDIMEAMGQIRQRLSQRIECMSSEDDIIDRGGVYALVGTTGVGKTTTVAKLAARCTLKHGPQHVALLTTDSYRIGAHDQLKAYGRILSVPVYGIRDESDLISALSDLSTRRLILIDTIGMSQKDRRLVEQVALLGRQGGKVQQLLLIAANAQASTLEDIVRAYGSSQLAGVIISKTDEAAQIGSVLDVLIRHRLRLCYLTDGQRVPEDLHIPNPNSLVDRAFQDIVSESPLALTENEYPLVWK